MNDRSEILRAWSKELHTVETSPIPDQDNDAVKDDNGNQLKCPSLTPEEAVAEQVALTPSGDTLDSTWHAMQSIVLSNLSNSNQIVVTQQLITALRKILGPRGHALIDIWTRYRALSHKTV